jgi:Notch-like protein
MNAFYYLYLIKGGTCYTNAELIVGCECPCQYQGRQCQTPTNFCANNLCQNGVCVPNPNSCGYTCACNAGYLGKNCEVPINACFSLTNNSISNCLNGATCIDLHYTYTCQCTPGFTGNNCQIPRNTCNPNNCKNGATCIALSNDYVCTCPCPFYTGKNCDVLALLS